MEASVFLFFFNFLIYLPDFSTLRQVPLLLSFFFRLMKQEGRLYRKKARHLNGSINFPPIFSKLGARRIAVP